MSASQKSAAEFRKKQLTAFVVGYTGEVGSELVKALAQHNLFSKVILLGRRNVQLPESSGSHKLVQRQIDFDKVEELSEEFRGAEPMPHAIQEGFKKVDHDYVVNVAKVAQKEGLRHYHVVTSTGSNAKSPLLYPKTKGRTEEDLRILGLERLSIYRPGVLLCNREEARPADTAAKWLLAPVAMIAPTLATVPTSVVGRAMAVNAVIQTEPGVEILENKAIHAFAKMDIGV